MEAKRKLEETVTLTKDEFIHLIANTIIALDDDKEPRTFEELQTNILKVQVLASFASELTSNIFEGD